MFWVSVVVLVRVVVVFTVVVTGSDLQPAIVSSTRETIVIKANPVFFMLTSV